MSQTVAQVALLLLIAAVVVIVSRRFHLPFTVGLVLAGSAMAVFRFSPGIALTKELVFVLFLPPLVFEAAVQLEWRPLRRELPVIGSLATVGLLIAAATVAAGMAFFLGWDWRTATLFAVLISATDTVSVLATMKEAGIIGRVRVLVDGESLFNDGMAAVLFAVASAAVSGTTPSALGVFVEFARTAGGGAVAGMLVGGLSLVLLGRTEDRLVEVTVTTVAAYGSFVVAEELGMSGVIATLSAGLVMRNMSSIATLTDEGRVAARTFWEFAAFIAASLVFLLMGDLLARRPLLPLAGTVAVAILLAQIGRGAAVLLAGVAFARTRLAMSALIQMTLFWGGLRGALALALALGLPPNLPRREEAITATFGVVAFSLVAQGLSITPLLRRLARAERVA